MNNTDIRLDTGEIFKHERTDEGYLRIWMAVSKVGDLTYYDSAGKPYKEMVSRETLFDSESLDTAWGKVLTFGDHPKNQSGYHLLDSKNTKYDSVGMTMQSMLPSYSDDRLNILAVVTDQDAIDGIEGGVKEVSAAYKRTLQMDGNKLHQVNRRYNHFSILPRGRAGKEASVYFDSFNCDILGGPIIHNEKGEIQSASASSDIIKTSSNNSTELLQILNYGKY